jgi:hypothetical protein
MVNGSVLLFGEPVRVPRVVCKGFITSGSQAKVHPGDRPRGLLSFFEEERLSALHAENIGFSDTIPLEYSFAEYED